MQSQKIALKSLTLPRPTGTQSMFRPEEDMSQPEPSNQTLALPGSPEPVLTTSADWRLDEHVRRLTWLLYEFARDIPELIEERIRNYSRARGLAAQAGSNVTVLPPPTAECERLVRLARVTEDAWAALRRSSELASHGLIEEDEQLAPVFREAAERMTSTNGN
jgi:hypothetical protein